MRTFLEKSSARNPFEKSSKIVFRVWSNLRLQEIEDFSRIILAEEFSKKSFDGRLLKMSYLKKLTMVNCKSNSCILLTIVRRPHVSVRRIL